LTMLAARLCGRVRPTAVHLNAARALAAARVLSTKVVATATGPDRPDSLACFTRAVLGQGGQLGGSRAQTVSGTSCISAVVFLPEPKSTAAGVSSVTDLSWALQTNLQDYHVSIRPAKDTNPPVVFGRVKVSAADEMGTLAVIADHLGSRSISFGTMRAQTDASRYGADGIEGTDDDEDPLYNAVFTLLSNNASEDVLWIEKEIYELADKMDVAIEYERLLAE